MDHVRLGHGHLQGPDVKQRVAESEDALAVDWPRLLANVSGEIRIAANLPYVASDDLARLRLAHGQDGLDERRGEAVVHLPEPVGVDLPLPPADLVDRPRAFRGACRLSGRNGPNAMRRGALPGAPLAFGAESLGNPRSAVSGTSHAQRTAA